MKKLIFMCTALVLFCGLAYAAQGPDEMANEPVGAVVQTFGFFVGRVVNVIDEATTGKKAIAVENMKGEQKVFPFAQTVKITDETFNALTFNQLKKGDTVSVEYKKGGEEEPATAVMLRKQ